MKQKTYPYIILLAGLPKGIAEKACRNAEKFFERLASDNLQGFYLEKESSHIHSSLVRTFPWMTSREGQKYWDNLHTELCDMKI